MEGKNGTFDSADMAQAASDTVTALKYLGVCVYPRTGMHGAYMLSISFCTSTRPLSSLLVQSAAITQDP
jgi:hypothetical protein